MYPTETMRMPKYCKHCRDAGTITIIKQDVQGLPTARKMTCDKCPISAVGGANDIPPNGPG